MNPAVHLTPVGGGWRIEGELTFETVTGALRQSRGAFGGDSLVIDLAGVAKVDSAGLALLLEWMREARRAGGQVRYRHIPEQALAIARTGDIESLLPLATD